MRSAWLLCVFFLTSCATHDGDLWRAISYGEIAEVNGYSSEIEKSLYVRMYQAPIYNEYCFVETHGICKYKYYFSVSTFDEYPEVNLFELRHQGEVVDIRWLENNDIDSATIEFRMSKYTKEALQNNSALAVEVDVFQVVLTPHSMDEL